MNIIAVAIGGAIGALLRYGVSGLANAYISKNFAWGTLSANLIGAVLIGLLWGFFEKINISDNMKLFLFVGFLGGFTTFSSYALDCFRHFEQDGSKIALLYVALSNFLGIFFVFAAVFAARYFNNNILNK
jgi:CrcB protein